LSSTTDEEKNEQLMKAFDDAFKDQKVELLIGPELLGPSSN
jgi:hypothetical protein